MLRNWFKEILRELFADEIKTLAFDFIESKVSDTIENDIRDALAPAMIQIKDYNANIIAKVAEIDKVVTNDINISKKVITNKLIEISDKLPGQLDKLEIELTGINQIMNDKVKKVITYEITKNQNSGYTNHVTKNVQSQFRTWCSTHNFINFK